MAIQPVSWYQKVLPPLGEEQSAAQTLLLVILSERSESKNH